jgi:hypothetical protein
MRRKFNLLVGGRYRYVHGHRIQASTNQSAGLAFGAIVIVGLLILAFPGPHLARSIDSHNHLGQYLREANL